MRIVFLCGCLEPGKDGVGDYTTRLAMALIEDGHQAGIIALNDRFVTLPESSTTGALHALRLPSALSWNERMANASEFIEDFNPEWLSLQYVPFSFNAKGLAFGFAGKLRQLAKGRKCYLMFHELWVGMDRQSSYKFKLWGSLQKWLISDLIATVRPALMHTQNQLYKFQLESMGADVGLLPLFGNIPVKEASDTSIDNQNEIRVVVFGGIHHGALIDEFISELKRLSLDQGKKITMVFVGQNGAEKKNWIQACVDSGIAIADFGPQPPEKVSEIMSASNLGVTSTPYLLTEKSGSVAAMLEHGLRIICLARDWTVAKVDNDITIDHVFRLGDRELSRIIDSGKIRGAQSNLRNVADLLTRELLTR